jgi:hypothetical protein
METMPGFFSPFFLKSAPMEVATTVESEGRGIIEDGSTDAAVGGGVGGRKVPAYP